jgi:hypothetical protein
MKLYIYALAGCLLLSLIKIEDARAQGCVAVKNMSSHSLNFGDESTKGWQFSLNYRYFRSFRHFKGTEEQKERLVNNTEVINNDNSIILGVDYTISDKWNVSISLPYVFIDRSSLYEHDRVSRHHTQSQGVGDIRIVGYRSFQAGKTGSLQVGLGVKLPTGDYNFQDYFQTTEGPQLRPVDQSIQLGDGGTGVIVELNGMKQLGHTSSAYINSMYMLNARNTNGTRTFRETLSPSLANEAIMSVADQYFLRAGAQLLIEEKIIVGAGVRLEGIPADDLVGKSEGFRRPGHILSAEPTIGYSAGSHLFNLSVPIALVRNRTQSLTDKETQRQTGVPRHGDAAFADYLISFTYAYQLKK